MDSFNPSTRMVNGVLYEDILYMRRNGSDLRFSAKEWIPDITYNYAKKDLCEEEFLEKILLSRRVQHVINKLATKDHTAKQLRNLIAPMVKHMAHTLNVGTIRKFALVLPKIMKKIYKSILVNKSGIEQLKCIMADTPVLLLPTHRSYADFLLLSYIAFQYDIPFPVIAAGMDFMDMAIIGDMLRSAGAFYIRRSFVGDQLYWAVFQEYVQSLILSGNPLEFFLEGTRSRTGKSLYPKLGLLGCAMESWMRGKVPDIAIVPISISYNRTLEESLYAFEMLGVPKPKESTSGLLKAMKILKENFGDIYVHFGAPINAAKFLKPIVPRHLNSYPFHVSSLSKQELVAIESLACYTLRRQQKNCILNMWNLCCIVLMNSCLWKGSSVIQYEILVEEIIHLLTFVKELGAVVEDENFSSQLLGRSLDAHKDTVYLDSKDVLHIKLNCTYKPVHKPKGSQSLKLTIIENSFGHLLLQYYVNQTLHVFIHVGFIEFLMENRQKTKIGLDILLAEYAFLCEVFQFEFIFEKNCLKKEFDRAVSYLVSKNYLKLFDGHVSRPNCSNSIANGSMNVYNFESLIINLIKPFLLCYQGGLVVASSQIKWDSESSLFSYLQLFLQSSVEMHHLGSSLSVDTCKNCIKMMCKMGALEKVEEYADVNDCLVPNRKRIHHLQKALGPNLIISNQKASL